MTPSAVGYRVAAFAAVAILVIAELAMRYLGLATLFSPDYTVHAHFRDSGGIFVGAEVDARGIKVGRVSGMTVAPDGVIVDLSLGHGTAISARAHATVTDRSALGEQFIALTPPTGGGPFLHAGSGIARSATTIPVATQALLSSLDSPASSISSSSLTTVLQEVGAAFDGAGPKLASILDSTTRITATALADLRNTVALINDSQTVLDTQVASAGDIATFSTHLASLSGAIRALDPTLASVFARGVSATTQVTDLLDDTQQALPVLLNNLVTVSDVVSGRVPQLRKLLVTFPHALEYGLTLVRYCDKYDANTGKPVASSCHYDPQTGLPAWSAHFGLQYATTPAVCNQGYGGTAKYLPNGHPLSRHGRPETQSAPANPAAGCTAAPTSKTPNVRGAQNAVDDSNVGPDAAVYDPLSGGGITADGSAFTVSGPSSRAPSGLGDLLTMGAS